MLKNKESKVLTSNENIDVVSLEEKIKETDTEFDYYLFEEYYRGSREEIINRQKKYLKYFSEGQYVLDLGCGRGEFTELLLSKGIKVTCVDIDEDMVAYCKDRGFPIVKSDLFSYLNSVPDRSVDGIFLGQVIEHLTTEQFISLVNISYRKLKPMGYFIAETPNPRSLSIFAQSFYMDPTHVKPVHPYTSKFVLESAGFFDVEIHYFSPNHESTQLPYLELEGVKSNSLDKFNQVLQVWNEIIFGNQDYYVVGRK
ncbi:class I SAM-dependent methyltransferase [Aneurinibacillus thermoaerophilus]|nr:class I SAM-dependent methyltransferase [Aneurinibacillus thermoaerophilus]MED0759324.1 class I SAM-dependent methyltransferase [Aneurinibacillus thermoaerophilus]